MAEPEHSHMHNFAYHPGVASWVQSLDSGDELAGNAADDFYKSPRAHTSEVPQPDGMTTTRQRQQTANGAPRSTPKPSIRSVSGPATSTSTTSTPRSAPHIQFNRPTVKSLAQKFNQPSSADSSPQSTRAHPVRPPAASASSSPARPAKEASYGSYKFNNLKPRDRPQPAPPSPSHSRRANGTRSGLDHQKVPQRKKVASPIREKGRQPFFGEVIGEHDAVTPGFGIPSFDGAGDSAEPAPNSQQQASHPGASTIKIVTDELPSLPEGSVDAFSPHSQRSVSDMSSHRSGAARTAQSPQPLPSDQRSPRSRIPVASRRLSVTSDSSSSTRSARLNPTRPSFAHDNGTTTPTRPIRNVVGRSGTTPKSATSASNQPTLSASRYRGYRERGKQPQAGGSGAGVPAVIAAPLLPPTSPRLRNSRERQGLQLTPGSQPRSTEPQGPQGTHDYFNDIFASQDTPHMLDPGHAEKRLSVRLVDPSHDEAGVLGTSVGKQELDRNIGTNEHSALHLSTDCLAAPAGRPSSATTTFEESPILGMPGSFMMTPPIAQAQTPPMDQNAGQEQNQKAPSPSRTPQLGGELLQARAFQPASKGRIRDMLRIEEPQEEQSELGVRESIPVMLGSEVSSPGWNKSTPKRSKHKAKLSIGSQTWRIDPLDSTGTISYLDEETDESPTDPFANRSTLMPDDSASMAFYHQPRQQSPPWVPKAPEGRGNDSFTLDSEAYSVINKILNVYHESATITPQIAQESWDQVKSVSPMVAQHSDWGSKEATETYLARLLSDSAAVREGTSEAKLAPAQPVQHAASAPSIRQLAADPDEPFHGGTAIIFPSESRRYSKSSRASVASTTTTIQEGPSRPVSSSGIPSRDRAFSDHGNGLAPGALSLDNDWTSPLAKDLQLPPLPTIASAGEGLGLSLQHSQEQLQQQQQQQTPNDVLFAPPRPPYSPPPPPNMGPVISRLCGDRDDGDEPDDYDDRPLLDRTPPPSPPFRSRWSQPQDPEPSYGTMDGPADGGSNEGGIMAGALPSYEKLDQGPPTPADVERKLFTTPEERAEEERIKAAETVRKRYRVIEELCKTEHSFCVDMMVAHQIFEGTSREVLTDAERKLLFSNCKDLENFSHNLWKSLKESIRPIVNQLPPEEHTGETYNEFVHCTPENDRETRVGDVMLTFAPRMERVYTTYYLNYGDASDFIKKNAQNPELLGWVMACFQHCPNLTTAWDLDSLLIKPVQRMLRYPILLTELIEKTAPDHPDLPQIKEAKETIVGIANRIDIAKKRQETLRAATSEGKKQKAKSGPERNVKSIVKAFRWSKEKAKTLQEAALIFEDQEYNQVTQKFGGHFFQIQIVIADLEGYLEALTQSTVQLNCVMLGFITVAETAPSTNAEIESTWRRWAMAHLDLQNKALDEHKLAVRNRVMKPISDLWDQWVGPQKLMEQRKKLLIQYAKYKQAIDRKEKIDPKLEETAKSFLTINDSLKQELPKLYELTKKCIRIGSTIFIGLSKDWYKTCSKKILPLLENEPQHTTSISYDFKTYQERFKSDFRRMEQVAQSLAIVNHELINSLSNYVSPIPVVDDNSSRKSSSRRTESVGSEMSVLDRHNRNRNSGGYNSSRSGMHSLDGPPRSSPAASYGPGSAPPVSFHNATTSSASSSMFRERSNPPPLHSPNSDTTAGNRSRSGSRLPAWTNMNTGFDGAFDMSEAFAIPASIGASFLQPAFTPSMTTPSSQPTSSRTSGVFNSALPMSTSSARASTEELPATPSDPDEPEVLFLAASLFEFNIAHDRREGGIPYLVYVPGEIFDVIGMKGELWLARNQDDATRTVGWIWEKHFARILPEDA